MVARLKEATSIRMGMTGSDGKPVRIDFDVPGIARALAALGF